MLIRRLFKACSCWYYHSHNCWDYERCFIFASRLLLLPVKQERNVGKSHDNISCCGGGAVAAVLVLDASPILPADATLSRPDFFLSSMLLGQTRHAVRIPFGTDKQTRADPHQRVPLCRIVQSLLLQLLTCDVPYFLVLLKRRLDAPGILESNGMGASEFGVQMGTCTLHGTRQHHQPEAANLSRNGGSSPKFGANYWGQYIKNSDFLWPISRSPYAGNYYIGETLCRV